MGKCTGEITEYSSRCQFVLREGWENKPLIAILTLNPLKTKRWLFYLKTQFVPRSKHFSSRL